MQRRSHDTTVDYMLDDCFQLISLAYMTIGKNHEPPAVYVLASLRCCLHAHLPRATDIPTFPQQRYFSQQNLLCMKY